MGGSTEEVSSMIVQSDVSGAVCMGTNTQAVAAKFSKLLEVKTA